MLLQEDLTFQKLSWSSNLIHQKTLKAIFIEVEELQELEDQELALPSIMIGAENSLIELKKWQVLNLRELEFHPNKTWSKPTPRVS